MRGQCRPATFAVTFSVKEHFDDHDAGGPGGGLSSEPRMSEVSVPTPTEPIDVVVKIGGTGVCRTDLHILEGQWAQKSQVQVPYTIGHENSGWVDAVGSAVTNVKEGDKVIVHPLITCGLCRACRAGDDVHCAANSFPALTPTADTPTTLKTSARSVVKLDDAQRRRSRRRLRRRGDVTSEGVQMLRRAADYHVVG